MKKRPRVLAEPEQTLIISASQLARMMKRSRDWARAQIARWKEEQDKGGPQRVMFTSPPGGGRPAWCTTLGAVQAFFGFRDYAMERRITRLEKDLEFLSKRLDDEISARVRLERRVFMVERST